MEHLTTELNAEGIPFLFKVLNNPQSFPRTDAAVLYIDKGYLNAARTGLMRTYLMINTFLNSSTSIFSKRLVPGLAIAEDVGSNESFGKHRSRILAEALTSACDKTTLTEKIAEVVNYFKMAGLDVYRPYLNANSVDDYDGLLKSV